MIFAHYFGAAFGFALVLYIAIALMAFSRRRTGGSFPVAPVYFFPGGMLVFFFSYLLGGDVVARPISVLVLIFLLIGISMVAFSLVTGGGDVQRVGFKENDFLRNSKYFDEEAAFGRIAGEIESKEVDRGVWLQALVQSSGAGENAQVVAYTKLRLAKLRLESDDALQRRNLADANVLTSGDDQSGKSREDGKSGRLNDSNVVAVIVCVLAIGFAVVRSLI